MVYLKLILIVVVIVFTVTTCNTEDNTPIRTHTHTHTWGEWAVAKEPTCTETGIGARVCIICNVTDSNTSIPSEHKWGEWVAADAPTCTETGAGIRICSICNVPGPSDIIPSLGHDYSEWTEPTCTEAATRTCTRIGCEEKENRTGYTALGHNYPAWTEPTCTVAGNSKRTCTRAGCGQEDTLTTGYAALGHNFGNGICTVCYSIEMVQIPSGTFTMGSPANEPTRNSDETQRQITISKGFYMGKYEVTWGQYLTVIGRGGIQSRRPVESVTWYDAVEFCNKLSEQEGLTKTYTITDRYPTSGNMILSATVTVNWDANGYRLPTEAEWEYACRAGTTTAFNTRNNTISDADCWYRDNSGSITHEVGLKSANAWGLHDMLGNVGEWCWDLYGSYESGAQIDPRGAASGYNRVVRGGSWAGGAQTLRSAYRGSYYPHHGFDGIGFRVVRP